VRNRGLKWISSESEETMNQKEIEDEDKGSPSSGIDGPGDAVGSEAGVGPDEERSRENGSGSRIQGYD
jgi:hypothetical protein